MIRKFLTIAITALLAFPDVYSQPSQDSILRYSMNTRWTEEVDPENVWPAYPRPQMVRENWENLNGYWQYAIRSKEESQPESFEGNILVPYPVESALSQVKRTVGEDNYLWYKKTFEGQPLKANERTLLHFGAVDWESTVYLNGQEIGVHRGGYDPFTFDITEYLRDGEQELIVRVWDPTDAGMQARGKQVNDPRGIWYTPVTGIWQTVWLENVPQDYIQQVKVTPEVDERKATVALQFPALSANSTLQVKALADGKEVGSKEVIVEANSQEASLSLDIENPVLWSPDDPFLYDLQISLMTAEGQVVDKVKSYFGMRKISLGKGPDGYTRIMLNDEPLFQFGLLDQGWWPDGLYTPPTEEAMVYDLQVTQDLGFNMLRKHVKVEPARYYYHCDTMGLLVWQDMPSGFNTAQKEEQHVKHDAKADWQRPKESAVQFEQELQAMIDNFYSFPSIVVWVPLNEGWGQYDTKRLADWVKSYDPSRLVDAPSGWADREVGDMIDVHLYPGPGMELSEKNRASVLGEFGGLGWPVKDHLWWNKRNWGYLTYQDKATYQKEFGQIVENLQGLISWGLSGAIYTQTTDVEGEVNGLMTYDREVLKLDLQEVRQLVKPLYKPWWNKRVLVSDSEHEPQAWQVSFQPPSGEWSTPEYDDFDWSTANAPFSAQENPFLPKSTEWKSDTLYLRQTFSLGAVPEQVYLKYYAPKVNAKVYLNGELATELKEGGGRKRHYTHILLNDASSYLTDGENIIAVEAVRSEPIGAFDIGIYATQPVSGNAADKDASLESGE